VLGAYLVTYIHVLDHLQHICNSSHSGSWLLLVSHTFNKTPSGGPRVPKSTTAPFHLHFPCQTAWRGVIDWFGFPFPGKLGR
jgi:hypothetical protein